jgi:hypothetical protein
MAKGLMDVKKGNTVVMLGFTGIRLADVVVADCDKKTISIETKKNGTLVFDRKTGKQQDMAEGKEKYANTIVHPEDAPKQKKAAPATKKDKKEDKKTSDKKGSKKSDEDEEEDSDDEGDKEESKSSKKDDKKSKKSDKKSKMDEDDDGYEEV